MDLYECQAKGLFAKNKVPVQRGIVVSTPARASAAYRELSAESAVVKAQVKTGGHGKAGGVKLACNAGEAETMAQNILEMDIKGHPVHRVLIAEGVDIEWKFYFSILLDRANRRNLVMCSVEGKIETERLAKEKLEALAKVSVPRTGMDETSAMEITQQAGPDPKTGLRVIPVILKLRQTYVDEDATLVEVNPLVRTPAGDIIVLDAKATLDDNARYRHPEHSELVDQKDADRRELKV